jgi:hypothetical protein
MVNNPINLLPKLFLEQGLRPVLRAVIHDDDFSALKRRLANSINDLFDRVLLIVTRNYNRDFHVLHTPKEFRDHGAFNRLEGNFVGETERLCLTDRFDIPRQNACADNQD